MAGQVIRAVCDRALVRIDDQVACGIESREALAGEPAHVGAAREQIDDRAVDARRGDLAARALRARRRAPISASTLPGSRACQSRAFVSAAVTSCFASAFSIVAELAGQCDRRTLGRPLLALFLLERLAVVVGAVAARGHAVLVVIIGRRRSNVSRPRRARAWAPAPCRPRRDRRYRPSRPSWPPSREVPAAAAAAWQAPATGPVPEVGAAGGSGFGSAIAIRRRDLFVAAARGALVRAGERELLLRRELLRRGRAPDWRAAPAAWPAPCDARARRRSRRRRGCRRATCDRCRSARSRHRSRARAATSGSRSRATTTRLRRDLLLAAPRRRSRLAVASLASSSSISALATAR